MHTSEASEALLLILDTSNISGFNGSSSCTKTTTPHHKTHHPNKMKKYKQLRLPSKAI